MPKLAPTQKSKDEHITHLLGLLEPLGGVTARSMFGEYGFFKEGIMFALVYLKEFYVRVDERTKALHEARGLKQFVYVSKTGRRTPMPYYQVPTEAHDDPDEMTRWAAPAFAAARAAKVVPAGKGKGRGLKKPTTAPAAKTVRGRKRRN